MTLYQGLMSRTITAAILIVFLCIGIFFTPQWLWAVGLLAPVAVAALEYARLFGWSLRRARAFTFILIAVCAVHHDLPQSPEYGLPTKQARGRRSTDGRLNRHTEM